MISLARDIARTVVDVDRSALRPAAGVRPALGLAIVLLAAAAVHHTPQGVLAAVGALSAGFASFQGIYRTRVAAVAATGVAMAASTLVGALAGHHVAALVAAVTVVGFLAGLGSAAGPTSTTIGLQAVVALLVVSAFPITFAAALQRAGFVLAGAAVQLFLVTVTWPFERQPHERRVTAAAYRSLARFAAKLPPDALPDTATVPEIGRVLADPQPRVGRQSVHRFGALLDEAERLRTTLVALARARDRLQALDSAAAARRLDELAGDISGVLDRLADNLDAGHPPTGLLAETRRLERGLDDFSADLDVHALTRARTVVGHLQHAVSAAAGVDDEAHAENAAGPVAERGRPSVTAVFETMRANLSLQSAALRHAVRLAVTLALAVILGHFAGLARDYWIAMTTLVVLRSDFGSTITRGIARIIGTLVGAAVVTLVIAHASPGPYALSVAVGVLGWLGYTLVRANYAIYATVLTALVVLLLALVGLPGAVTAGARASDTVVGGALALAAFLAWPTWEATTARAPLAALLRAQGSYAGGVLAAYADPRHADFARIRALRSAARLARSNAEASLRRLRAEPPRAGVDPDAVDAVLDAVRGVARSSLSLQATLITAPAVDAECLAQSVADELHALADAVETDGLVPDGGDASAALGALTEAVDGDDPAVDAVLMEATLLVEAVGRSASAVAGLVAPGDIG